MKITFTGNIAFGGVVTPTQQALLKLILQEIVWLQPIIQPQYKNRK